MAPQPNFLNPTANSTLPSSNPQLILSSHSQSYSQSYPLVPTPISSILQPALQKFYNPTSILESPITQKFTNTFFVPSALLDTNTIVHTSIHYYISFASSPCTTYYCYKNYLQIMTCTYVICAIKYGWII